MQTNDCRQKSAIKRKMLLNFKNIVIIVIKHLWMNQMLELNTPYGADVQLKK